MHADPIGGRRKQESVVAEMHDELVQMSLGKVLCTRPTMGARKNTDRASEDCFISFGAGLALDSPALISQHSDKMA